MWASTGTKNPSYSPTKYIDELIGPETVNTMPPDTLEAFHSGSTIAITLTKNVEKARSQLNDLADAGIDLDIVTADLQKAGIKAFTDSFTELLRSVKSKRNKLLSPVNEPSPIGPNPTDLKG